MERRRFMTGIGLVTAGGVAGAGAGFMAEPALSAEGPTARTARPGGPDAYVTSVAFRTQPARQIAALTIDDGPTSEWTPQVLRLLARHQAQATFFVVGQRAQEQPGWVQRAAAAGHELANHTWAHSDLTQHDENFDRASLERTHELVTRLAGREPVLCRPPWGRIDSVGLAVCAGLRYTVTLWSDHITGSNAPGDVDWVLGHVSPGSIVLAHDGGPEPNTSLMQQLDRMVGSMTDSGYQFVTISELLGAQA
jgi:peptidoglycan/xylan/chitin deacetylase (PgdA/CDA1 family)